MALKVGERLFERYTIMELLGEGAFGRVYRARDTILPRDVAIKELRERWREDNKVTRRFVDDARAAAALDHPHIVTIYDIQPSNTPCFIIMEYLPNGSLRGLLKRQDRLPVERAIEISVDVLHALQAGHQKGIIHRDIKPENILLAETGRAKLCDFGIAHLPQELGGKSDTLRAGEHPGTPAYRSPEQVRGDRLDGRSDIYAAGVVLYEMLTGGSYFDLAGCKSQYNVDNAVLHYIPAPPSQKNAEVPLILDSVVMKMLAKEREQRYSNALEVIQALENCRRANQELPMVMQVRLIGISGSARREGDCIRFQIRIEAENQGNKAANWGGVTINVPTVNSGEIFRSTTVQAWSIVSASPFWRGPEETIFGFRDDGSFGEIKARCLLIESLQNPWEPWKRIALEAALSLPVAHLEVHVRTWATWVKEDGSQVTNGDPAWTIGIGAPLDQQGIPAYPLSIGFV